MENDIAKELKHRLEHCRLLSNPLMALELDTVAYVLQLLERQSQKIVALEASRTPIKWPTYQQIIDASDDYSFDSVDGENAIEWLKSFVEKGE